MYFSEDQVKIDSFHQSKDNDDGNKKIQINLQKEIQLAKKEWEYSLKRFNDVSDPEVVDYIVYYILAAERRYMYLLNKYKNIVKDIQEEQKQIRTKEEN